MASIKNLEMAEAIANDSRIEIKKSLFGTKALYAATQSVLEVKILEYNPDQGARLERLLAQPIEKLKADVQKDGAPRSTAVGQYRLEILLARDGRFAAAQLFRFADFVYHPVSKLITLDGGDVDVINIIAGA